MAVALSSEPLADDVVSLLVNGTFLTALSVDVMPEDWMWPAMVDVTPIDDSLYTDSTYVSTLEVEAMTGDPLLSGLTLATVQQIEVRDLCCMLVRTVLAHIQLCGAGG